LKIELLKNLYNDLYKEKIHQKYLSIVFSKSVRGHNSYFEIKLFHRSHYDYYELYYKVFSFETYRFEKKEGSIKKFETYHKHYMKPSYRESDPIIINNEAITMKEEIGNTSYEIYKLKRKLHEKTLLAKYLEKTEHVRFTKELVCNYWTLVFGSMILLIFLLTLCQMTNYGLYTMNYVNTEYTTINTNLQNIIETQERIYGSSDATDKVDYNYINIAAQYHNDSIVGNRSANSFNNIEVLDEPFFDINYDSNDYVNDSWDLALDIDKITTKTLFNPFNDTKIDLLKSNRLSFYDELQYEQDVVRSYINSLEKKFFDNYNILTDETHINMMNK